MRRLSSLREVPFCVSLKYLGSRTSEKVKTKILELLYSWTVILPGEVKIAEAYQMLKKQGERAPPQAPPTAQAPAALGFASKAAGLPLVSQELSH